MNRRTPYINLYFCQKRQEKESMNDPSIRFDRYFLNYKLRFLISSMAYVLISEQNVQKGNQSPELHVCNSQQFVDMIARHLPDP